MTLSVGITFDTTEQPWSHQWKQALAAGIRACGDTVELLPAPTILANVSKYHVTATWGLRGGRRGLMHTIGQRGGRHLVMERGLLGDRERWTALSFDGIAGRGDAPVITDPARFAKHHAALMQPWREPREGAARAALILGQVNGDATTRHVDLPGWMSSAARGLKGDGWRVFYRHHPLERQERRRAPPGATVLDGTLAHALGQVGLAVTFNSTSAVDAVLYGTPTFSADVGSPAYEVTSRAYQPQMFDRTEWAAKLAWRQWTEEEIRSGLAWQHLRTIAQRKA